MAEAGIDAPLALQGVDVGEAPWFVLAESERYVVVATGTWDEHGPRLEDDGQAVRLERKASGWKVVGWGSCSRLVPVVEPGRRVGPGRVRGDLDPRATEVRRGDHRSDSAPAAGIRARSWTSRPSSRTTTA